MTQISLELRKATKTKFNQVSKELQYIDNLH
jgi:hypothetical protein